MRDVIGRKAGGTGATLLESLLAADQRLDFGLRCRFARFLSPVDRILPKQSRRVVRGTIMSELQGSGSDGSGSDRGFCRLCRPVSGNSSVVGLDGFYGFQCRYASLR